MSKKKSNTPKTRKPASKTAEHKGGIILKAGRDTNIGGDLVGGNKTQVNSYPEPGKSADQNQSLPQPEGSAIHSAWANGLFYLFVFVVVAGLIGWMAGTLELAKLGLVIVGGILAVPLIGAFQLRMDARLSEKTFFELIKVTISQLPIIKALNKAKT